MHRSYGVYFILICFQILAWTSCQKEKKPSFLIIAVEKLPSDLVNCSEQNTSAISGIQLLCKESIRFTHSYTTSLQSAAAVGSLLSGKYPLEHKLHRSFNRIDNKTIMLQQSAYEKNYNTSFFSGSPSIMKKTGLSNYFETFDDSISSSATEFHQDLNVQFEQFLNWINNQPDEPFFSVIFNTELNSLKNIETDQTQFEKWDEKLNQFFIELKSRNLWNNTYIVLVGLSGQNRFNRQDLNAYTNLHSENSNIATLIKSPRKKGDEGIYWKNDVYITLADIGETIHSMIEPKKAKTENPENLLSTDFSVINLNKIIEFQKGQISPEFINRSILIEAPIMDSAKSPIRYSIISNNIHYIQSLSFNLEIFNTLTDKNETQDLVKTKNTENLIEWQSIENKMNALKKQESKLLDSVALNSSNESEYLMLLSKMNSDYWQSNQSKSTFSIQEIKTDNPLYLFTKNNKLSDNLKNNDNLQNNLCFQVLNTINLNSEDLKNCTDDLFLNYILMQKSTELQLAAEKTKLQYDLSKSQYFNEMTKLSVNLSYYNNWGLFKKNQNLIHPLFYIDSNFSIRKKN